MWISKAVLVTFILLHFLEVDVCESKDSSVALMPSGKRGGSVSRGHHHVAETKHGEKRKGRCNRRMCKNGGRKSAHADNVKRRKKMLCKKNFDKCKLKKVLQCKNRKCIKKNLKKCRRPFKKCKKANNRRPKPTNTQKIVPPTKNDRVLKGNVSATSTPVKKEANEVCKVTSDCAGGLCCAKHGHIRICKSYITLGQICPRPYKRKRSPEMYEQCPCQAGLSCSKSESRHHTCQLMHT